VHIRENDSKKNVFLCEVFKSSFWWFFMFFQEELAWKPARKICNLQVKLSIVMLDVQNWTSKKVLKQHEKTWKYEARNLKNGVPVRAKWSVLKKLFFVTKSRKCNFEVQNKLSPSCQNPIFFNEFVGFLHSKKVNFLAPFWLRLGGSCSQNPIFYNEFEWF